MRGTQGSDTAPATALGAHGRAGRQKVNRWGGCRAGCRSALQRWAPNEDARLSRWGIRYPLREEDALELGPERVEEKSIPSRGKAKVRAQSLHKTRRTWGPDLCSWGELGNSVY